MESSENSLKILEFFSENYGQLIAPVALFKVCAVVSAKLSWPRLSILNVAPTRQFKSVSSNLIEKMFPANYSFHVGSDFTIHSLYKETKGKVDKKCLFINDGTLLLTSKTKRGKDRLVNALAEVLSDGKYHYGDFQNSFDIKGKCTVVMNMTLEAFNRYENSLLSNTFLERFLTVFHNMPGKEQHNYYDLREERNENAKVFPRKLTVKTLKVENVGEYRKAFIEFGKDYSALSIRSFLGCVDQVEALAVSHAVLNGRNRLCEDDMEVVRMAREYLVNPSCPNRSRIVALYQQGRSQRDICLLLNRDYEKYRPYVSKILKKARMRGVIG